MIPHSRGLVAKFERDFFLHVKKKTSVPKLCLCKFMFLFLLWMTNRNYTTSYTRLLKICYSDKNSQAWLKKTMDLWTEAKTETIDIVELKTRVSVMIREAKILIVGSLPSQWSMLKNLPLFSDLL